LRPNIAASRQTDRKGGVAQLVERRTDWQDLLGLLLTFPGTGNVAARRFAYSQHEVLPDYTGIVVELRRY
jgi:hypothetical protein